MKDLALTFCPAKINLGVIGGDGLPSYFCGPMWNCVHTIRLRTLLLGLLTCVSVPTFGQIFPNLGGQRAGISALTFLKNDLSPRSVALSGAHASLQGDAWSLNNNPASMAEVREFSVGVSNLAYSGLHHGMAQINIPTKDRATWVVSVNNLLSGPMEVRTEFQPFGTGEKFYANSFVGGVGYARSLSEMFSFGIFAKYIRENLAEYNTNTAAVDLGFLYRVDYQNLRFAASLQNFGVNSRLSGDARPVTFTRSGALDLSENQAPTNFKMGISMDVFSSNPDSARWVFIPKNRPDYIPEPTHVLRGSLQVNSPNDNAANIRLGLEYCFTGTFFLRGGYKINVDGEKWPTAGLGLTSYLFGTHRFQIDYAVSPTQYLGVWHSIGLAFYLSKPNVADQSSSQP